MARASANLDVAKRENSVITLEDNYQQTYKGFNPNKAESYVIFELMQDRYMKQSVDLARCIQRQYRSVGRPDKGVHQAGFLVLRNTSMPSVLTELGFISTPSEERYLNSAAGQQELSRSIYNGFLAYRRQHEPAQARFARRPSAQTARSRAKPKRKNNRALKKSRDDKESTPSNATRSSVKTETESRDAAVVPVNVVPTSQLNQSSQRNDEEPRNETPAKQHEETAQPAEHSEHAATHVAKPLRTKSDPPAPSPKSELPRKPNVQPRKSVPCSAMS